MAESLVQFVPRYRVIANELRQQIRDGRYLPNERIPSEAVLGKEYEVSRGTVREALDLLTHEKLIVRQHGIGTVVATTKEPKYKTTFVFSHAGAYSLTHPYLSRLYHSFEEGAGCFSSDHGSDVSVQSVRLAKVGTEYGLSLLESEDAFQARMGDPKYVQGLCLTASISDKEVIDIQKRGIFCVQLDGSEDSKCPTVYLDRYQMREIALLHLQELGHRKIGFVLTECDKKSITPWPKVMTRLKETAVKIGLELEDHFNVYCSDWKRELAALGVKELLRQSDRPTALICGDDILAMGAWDAANDMNVSVPNELSIVGFGDYIPDANLTTIRVPLEKMGRAGAKVLLNAIQGVYDGPDHICLDGAIILQRSSTGTFSG